MTKHLHLKKVLAAVLTIAALATGQQAFATVSQTVTFQGMTYTQNNNSYYGLQINGIPWGNLQLPHQQGTSCQFNNAHLSWSPVFVTLNGTLQFQVSTTATDVVAGGTFTVTFQSQSLWFYGASVKKLDGTDVTLSNVTISNDRHTVTVAINYEGTQFGQIILDYVPNEPLNSTNTVIGGIATEYDYTGRPIEPVPTVTYKGTLLTEDTDYTLSYTNTLGPGSAWVTITGIGQYAGAFNHYYNIRAIALSDFTNLGNNTYQIATTTDLDHLAGYVNLGNDCQGLTFKQTADITYSHGSSTTENNFTQIGGYFGGDKNFRGTYDGQNHTISGIRVYKDPTNNGNAYKNVALFGRISGATIQNVILTDARITGFRYVGGLVGNKASGTVQNCLVVGSTITCGDTYGGALFGSNNGTLTANHYRNCTVNNTTNATNVGVGNGSSSSDMAGARSMHPLTIQNANVTATGESVAYQGTTYYASNTQITLGYNNLPAGYTLTYTLNGTALSGNTFTMPANDNATVNASTALITYNITYDLDGGSVATPNPTTYNVTTPTFTLNNPTKVACNFDGWTGSNGNTPETTVTIAQGSTGDRDYTAHWTQYAFTLTLGTDITASGTVAFTYEGTDYYAVGTEITLAYGGTIPEGYRPLYSVNGNAIVGDTFEMPAADVVVDAVLLERYYTFNSTTGVLALLWGEFNRYNKWGSEVTKSAVTSVTATDEVSFTGDCYQLFYNFTSCTSMDLTDVNTANVTDMKYMFTGCWGLQSLNISGWNTANVTDMSNMFYNCESLQSLDLSGWNTANVTNMSSMFEDCVGLQSLNVSGWNTANVTDMSIMFYNCSGLQSLDLSGWNTANVTNMNTMFLNCSGLESLDVSNWNTANVTDMSNMFCYCESLQSLNLLGWNTANVTNMNTMFLNCSGLATIYVGEGWNTSRVNWSNHMFYGCTSLVGGMGTAYDANHIDKEYARIDGGSERPGYFTAPFTKEIAGYEDNESGWYLIASPLAADIAPTAVTNMTNETFDLYYFDQTGGTNGKEWKNWKNEGGDGYHFNLKTGKGYLYANSGNVTLMFTGTPYNGDGKVTLTKADGFEFSGWNLIGNPFSTAATLDKPFYRMNESGTALSAQVEAHNSVAAMEGVFVQASTNNETATFTQANNSKGGEKDAVPMLTLNLTRNRGEAIDNAIVRFDGGHTLEKFSFREGSTKIYIPQDGTDYAIATSNGQGEMPVNFKATENGTYTLTISTTLNSQLSTLNYLHLIDNMTGADVDLLTPEPVEGPATYTFTAKTTDYASRFKLVFSANGNADGDNDAFAFIDASGNIIVNGEGTLQVMDVMGRIIVSHGGHTRCVPTSGMQAGVYVLRLIDGENVRTQKIVIS